MSSKYNLARALWFVASANTPHYPAREFIGSPRKIPGEKVVFDVSFASPGDLDALFRIAKDNALVREVVLVSNMRAPQGLEGTLARHGFRLRHWYWAHPRVEDPLFIIPCDDRATFKKHFDAFVAMFADKKLFTKKALLYVMYALGLVKNFLPFIAVCTDDRAH